jgi:hypothetical protein
MEIIGHPELTQDPRFASFMNRTSIENEEALQHILEEWSASIRLQELKDQGVI